MPERSHEGTTKETGFEVRNDTKKKLYQKLEGITIAMRKRRPFSSQRKVTITYLVGQESVIYKNCTTHFESLHHHL